MSNKTKEELKAAFDSIDKNVNGNIDIGELQELLLVLNIPCNSVTLWKMMEQLDTTIPYGQVEFNEFYEWVQTHPHLGAAEGEALGVSATPSMPGADEWASRLDSIEMGPEVACVRHDVQGASQLSEKEVVEKYKITKKLGAGKYASVHLCEDLQSGELKAMKIFYKKGRAKRKFYDVIEEANKMRRVHDHPKGLIVKVYDLIETMERLIMLIEFVEGGQLYDEILARKPKQSAQGYFNEQMAGKIIGELTDAIGYMHARQVIHCDLKPENVLCTHNPATDHFDIKVADLGLSKVLESGVRQNLTYCGTPLYMAPEMLRKEQYSYPVDMWSIGCMMHELLCGEPPFTGRNMHELEKNVKSFHGLHSEPTKVTARIQKQFATYGVSPGAQDLIACLLHPDPSRRITASDAMAHDWIAKNDELSKDNMESVHLNLRLSVEKRKFRRTVQKIIMGQKIIRSIKYNQRSGSSGGHHHSGGHHSHPAKQQNQEEAGCNCTIV